MKEMQHPTLTQTLSSLLMLLMLTWLTVCLPFVNESRKSVKIQVQLTNEEAPEAEDSNPLSNTNEEKSEGGASVLSEYLHHLFQMEHTSTAITSLYKIHPSELYLAFHPELIIPPPEA
jgi:hypothetical protein